MENCISAKDPNYDEPSPTAFISCLWSYMSWAVTLPLLGCCAGACVPGAMSTFGTVVPGVGTFHAPLAAVGVAASLQAASVALISVRAAAVGAAMGSKVNEFL